MSDEELTKILAHMWILCDPNRGDTKKGSGYHPDDDITLHKDGEPYPAKRWEWFIPRAEAAKQYLAENGLKIVESDE